MAITRCMTRNHGYDAYSTKMINTCDNGGVAPWPDLNHDLLNSIMMRLGVVDFIAFSGVCKSWRSLALTNRNMFMVSSPLMSVSISTNANEKECILEDFEGRKFKTIIPLSAGRTCVGLTCGYFILYGKKMNDLRLVNPIKRHELHFSDVPFDASANREKVSAIIVFSPSIHGWVFVMLHRLTKNIWFSTAGTRAWNHVSSTLPVVDLHAFKGKIYTLHIDDHSRDMGHVYELSIAPNLKLTLLETKNFLKMNFLKSACWVGNLEVVQYRYSGDLLKVHELDIEEMKWVCREKKREREAFFVSMNRIVVVKRESWVDPPHLQFRSFVGTHKRVNYAYMWYFSYDCVNVIVMDE